MSYAQNASHYGHATRRMAESQPATPAQTARITHLLTTRASFDHLFTNLAERVSVLHQISRDWEAVHGPTTPTIDFLVERMASQIETKRAQLLQENDDYREPTLNEIQ
jgi:hypothetical protein